MIQWGGKLLEEVEPVKGSDVRAAKITIKHMVRLLFLEGFTDALSVIALNIQNYGLSRWLAWRWSSWAIEFTNEFFYREKSYDVSYAVDGMEVVLDGEKKAIKRVVCDGNGVELRCVGGGDVMVCADTFVSDMVGLSGRVVGCVDKSSVDGVRGWVGAYSGEPEYLAIECPEFQSEFDSKKLENEKAAKDWADLLERKRRLDELRYPCNAVELSERERLERERLGELECPRSIAELNEREKLECEKLERERAVESARKEKEFLEEKLRVEKLLKMQLSLF